MQRLTCLLSRGRRGSALVLSLIFLVVFSAMAVAMASMSGANVQIAQNYQRLDITRGCAESGLEVMRYWMSRVEMSGLTAADQRFTQLAAWLQNDLAAAGAANISLVCDGSTITVSPVTLLSSGNQSFSATFTKVDNDNVRLEITGHNEGITRTIRTNYVFGTRAHTVFDFGVASKGPVSLSGNVDLEGYNIDVESNAYIESLNNLLALSIIGNSQIAGRVKIVNPSAYVYLQGGNAGIGGVTGDAAAQPPYTEIGTSSAEFPEMNPSVFYGYVSDDDMYDPAHPQSSYDNLYIPQNTNPHFSSNVQLRGVVIVEAPNVVTFSGNVDITGIIVSKGGSPTDDSGTNQISFTGNVNSHPVSALPDSGELAGLNTQVGTFMLTPGFKARFGGNFDALCGAIAANGIEFHGNAGGTINGSVLNYSNATMTLSGNSDLQFNRSGLTEVPAGFVPELIMQYDPSNYSEVLL